jgi:hypothetical protein
MSRRCSNCKYSWGGSRDYDSDICDECTHDPDTGWGGFTDHSLEESKHFNTEEERILFYKNLGIDL